MSKNLKFQGNKTSVENIALHLQKNEEEGRRKGTFMPSLTLYLKWFGPVIPCVALCAPTAWSLVVAYCSVSLFCGNQAFILLQ